MHEVSIALAIVDEIAERLADDNCKRVASVYLRIGALSAVDSNALMFAWELATDGTPAAHSQLQIERVPLAIYCKNCAAERTIEKGIIPVCPVCAKPSAEIIRGRELLVTAMEVVDDASDRGSSAEHSAQEQHAGT